MLTSFIRDDVREQLKIISARNEKTHAAVSEAERKLAESVILQALEDSCCGDEEARRFFCHADFLTWARKAGLGLRARARLACLAQNMADADALGPFTGIGRRGNVQPDNQPDDGREP